MWLGYIHETLTTKALELRHSARCVFFIVYSSLFVDNILLTASVPVLPDFLRQIRGYEDFGGSSPAQSLQEAKAVLVNGSFGLNRISESVLEAHSASAAYIFAIKAFVQLIATPFVGLIVTKQGHRKVLSWAVYLLFSACLVLCWAESLWSVIASKFLHGLASAGVAISGLSSIAESYSDNEALRTKVIGRSMGAVALGVLVGYPFGGITYDLWGKDAVFIGILMMILPVVVVVMISTYNDHEDYEKFEETEQCVTVRGVTGMLTEPVVIIATGATLLSSASIAILEPTLPIWLIYTFNPPRWQIGTVFLPDSIGYFIGTHFFTNVTRHLSRAVSMFTAVLSIGIALFFIPYVSSLPQLIVPHFVIGLGIGCTDVSVLSLLASFGDIWYREWCYSMIYALNQAAVCVAYSLGPAWAGVSVSHFGFPATMTALSMVNVIYAPLALTLRPLEKALTRVHAKMESRFADE